MRSLRFDTFRLDTVERTPNGGLKIAATPTRAGVLTYRRADGTQVRELRHPSEVFKPESLATLSGAAVTDLHPPDPVTPTNHREHAVGHVGDNVGHDDRLVHATVYVNDARAMAKIADGSRKELSAGYYADTEDTPGIYEGQPYDRVQRNISYNHLSLQPPGGGRAGPECALRIDSDDAILVDDAQAVPDDATMTLRIDGRDATQTDLDGLITEREKLKGALAATEAKATKEKARADAAEDPKRIAGLVKARVKLLSDIRKGDAFFRGDAAPPEGDDAGADEGDDATASMTAAIERWNPSLKVAGKDPAYILGVFDAMIADLLAEGGTEPETQADAALTKPKNTPPEMELNGASAERANPTRAARRRIRADNGGMRSDSNGYPEGSAGNKPKSAEQAQNDYYRTLHEQPMAQGSK